MNIKDIKIGDYLKYRGRPSSVYLVKSIYEDKLFVKCLEENSDLGSIYMYDTGLIHYIHLPKNQYLLERLLFVV